MKDQNYLRNVFFTAVSVALIFLFLRNVGRHPSTCSASGKDAPISALRRFHVVNGHHFALKTWLKDMYRDGVMEDGNLTLLHIDSHPDLAFPRSLTPDMCENWGFGNATVESDNLHVWRKMVGAEEDNIVISSFIWPMVYCGRISRIIWIRNEWSRQLSDGVKQFHVGNVEGRGSRVRCVGCDDVYFGYYVPTGSVHLAKGTAKPVTLEVYNIDDLLQEEKVQPGAGLQDVLQLDPDRTLLDIDLDWFSTDNPSQKQLLKEFDHVLDEQILTRLSSLFRIENFCLNRELFAALDERQYESNDHLLESYKKYLDRLDASESWDWENRGEKRIPCMIPFDRETPFESRLKARLLLKLMTRYITNFDNMMLDMPEDQYREDVIEKTSPLWCHKSTPVSGFVSQMNMLREFYEVLEGTGDHSGSVSKYISSAINVPHHVSSAEVIISMGKQLRTFLSRSGLFDPINDNNSNNSSSKSPLVTTIARSENDEHTPPHQRQAIESLVYMILHDVITNKETPLTMPVNAKANVTH